MTEAKTKRTRVNIVKNVTIEMLTALPNVKVSRTDIEPLHAELRDIAYNSAIEQPTWEHNIEHGTRFTIKYGAEHLAHVDKRWSSRARAAIPMLRGNRDMGSGNRSTQQFSHKEAAQILRKIRKFVYPETIYEKVAPMQQNLYQHLYQHATQAQYAVTSSQQVISAAALEFALSPQGREAFLQYEATFGAAAQRNTAEKLEIVNVKKREHELLTKLRDVSGKTAPQLFRNDKGWFVVVNEAAKQYADDELPDEFSGVNILKLSPVGAMLEGIGIHTAENEFLLDTITTSQEEKA
jgi:hypothetical protein